MNRIYKFRAWDKDKKEMVVVTSINFWGSGPTGDGVKDVNSGMWVCPLMQFTGLHDKNGVEIYEGDILKGNTLVVFEDGMFIPRYNLGNEERLEDAGTDWWSSREVIGNIYENFELLK